MEKYVVRNKKTNVVFGRFNSEEEASKEILECCLKNKTIYKSIFDFALKTEEVSEINSYEEAKMYLGVSDESQMTICGSHNKALSALSKLFIIAEAWNKQDNFVPDFSNRDQQKYFPWFRYDDGAEAFVFEAASWTATQSSASMGARLCFASAERVTAFGKMFEELYNDFLLAK